MKKALITGITGQDGAYLARLLLEKGYEVHGIKRRSSLFNTDRVDDLYQDPQVENRRFIMHYGDLTDATNLIRLVQEIRPDEIYNIGAMSHVQVSFEEPEYTADVNALGVLRLLEAIRLLGLKDRTRFFQASTSEMYGLVREKPQREETPFHPRSPYGVSKVFGYWTTVNYREAYGIHANNGIMFNHESPLRGETFVTRKISRAVARIALGLQDKLYLGNLDAKRDWGHARDYMRAAWMMLQRDKPADYVISTGHSCSVREFAIRCFSRIGVDIEFHGEGQAEVGVAASVSDPDIPLKKGQQLIGIDPKYFRPAEVDFLLGDSTRIREELGWEPEISLDSLIAEMVDSDLELFRRERYLRDGGHKLQIPDEDR